jgi:hypothetical protein
VTPAIKKFSSHPFLYYKQKTDFLGVLGDIAYISLNFESLNELFFLDCSPFDEESNARFKIELSARVRELFALKAGNSNVLNKRPFIARHRSPTPHMKILQDMRLDEYFQEM